MQPQEPQPEPQTPQATPPLVPPGPTSVPAPPQPASVDAASQISQPIAATPGYAAGQTAQQIPVQPGVIPPQPTPAPGQIPGQVPAMQLNPAYSGSGLATASLILGIVSLPASILSIFTLPIPVVGIVLGIIGFKRKKSFAIAGIALSCIGLILSAAVLIIGINAQSKKHSAVYVTSSKKASSNSAELTADCYRFTPPNPLVAADASSNSDCMTVMIASGGGADLAVSSSAANGSGLSSSQIDARLKETAKNLEAVLGSKFQKTAEKSVTVDGVPGYYVIGTELGDPVYKNGGFLVMYSNKDYVSLNGLKLRLFSVSFDTAGSGEDFVNNVVQTWHWQ